MPAKSEKQQVAARIAHAIKKGKVKPKKGTASAQMAKGMSDKQIKHFMVREDDGGPGTTSVNIGGGPPTVNPGKKKSKLPPAFLRNIKKKKETEKKEEAAALQRVMDLVYAEEARLQKLT
jgi:hypothetical protein